MTTTLAQFVWTPLDSWIVVIGILCAVSSAILGNFLVLRRMSMMGDAISHAVLPGLAIAFLITGSRDSVTMLAGAAVVGVCTAVFTHWIHSIGNVDQGASMGVVFTLFFALGLLLIVQAADAVDLDPGCVLYGAIEYAPWDTAAIRGFKIPRAVLILGPVLLINAAFVTFMFKELQIVTFDPELARTVGINSTLVHYMLMTLVAVTTVAAFESVGSILVIAMLIVPAAAAHLLTDRLSHMIVWSVAIAILSAVIGHPAAVVVPGWFGYDGVSTNTAGMMAVASGFLFALAFFAAPQHGLLSRAWHRLKLTLNIIGEDTLGVLFRMEEMGRVADQRVAHAVLREATGTGRVLAFLAMRRLHRTGRLSADADGYHLTDAGRSSARELVRTHRLWESYLAKHLLVPAHRVHPTAEKLEHVTNAVMAERLSETLGHPTHDPHGSTIPGINEDDHNPRDA